MTFTVEAQPASRFAHEKMPYQFFKTEQDFLMDAEHINLIGNQLADLSNRVNELRGYL